MRLKELISLLQGAGRRTCLGGAASAPVSFKVHRGAPFMHRLCTRIQPASAIKRDMHHGHVQMHRQQSRDGAAAAAKNHAE